MTRKIPPDAFEYYVSLGPTRSYHTVAERYEVTTRAVTKCAARERWSERLVKIEQDARERCDRKLGDVFEEARERHLMTLKAMHARALTALKQYPLSSGMDAMRAAEMVIKLERLVMGEASERTEMTIEEVTKRELYDLLIVEDDDADDGVEEE